MPISAGAIHVPQFVVRHTPPAARHHRTRDGPTHHPHPPRSVGWEPDSIDSAVLVVSELITNAVEHANPPLSLDLQPHSPTIGSPDLRIQVTDGGPASAPGPWTRSCAADEHGRGKLLIAHLATPTEASNSVHSQEVTIPSKQG